MRQATFAYNHSDTYVNDVLAGAARYASQYRHTPVSAAAATACPDSNVPVNTVAAKVIAYARAQIGKPYVWGAAGPDAFDCSGLTMMAYRQAGIDLPHYAATHWAISTHIPDGQQQPGDLVFFEPKTDGPGHVGIYIGNQQMIAAPHTGATVAVSTVQRPDRIGYARPKVQ